MRGTRNIREQDKIADLTVYLAVLRSSFYAALETGMEFSMSNRMLQGLRLVGLLFCLAGCAEDEAADSTAQGWNPFLGGADLGNCPAPVVCDPEGKTSGDLYGELKQFIKSNPACTPVPEDLLCKKRSAECGMDWPEKVRSLLEDKSIWTKDFEQDRIDALVCLAFISAAEDGTWRPWGFGVGIDAGDVSLSLPLAPAEQTVASIVQYFEENYAGLLGVIWNLTDDYSFSRDVSGSPEKALYITYSLSTYKGLKVDPECNYLKIKITIDHLMMPDPESLGGSVRCGASLVRKIESTPSMQFDDLETDPDKLISSEEAVAAAQEECGPTCHWPGVDFNNEPLAEPELLISQEMVFWKVQLEQPDPCFGDSCASIWRVDASTGKTSDDGNCHFECPDI